MSLRSGLVARSFSPPSNNTTPFFKSTALFYRARKAKPDRYVRHVPTPESKLHWFSSTRLSLILLQQGTTLWRRAVSQGGSLLWPRRRDLSTRLRGSRWTDRAYVGRCLGQASPHSIPSELRAVRAV